MKKLFLLGFLLSYSASCLAMNESGPQEIVPTAPPLDDVLQQYGNPQEHTPTAPSFELVEKLYNNDDSELQVYKPSIIKNKKKIKNIVAAVINQVNNNNNQADDDTELYFYKPSKIQDIKKIKKASHRKKKFKRHK